jgi:hypothetical protein
MEGLRASVSTGLATVLACAAVLYLGIIPAEIVKIAEEAVKYLT